MVPKITVLVSLTDVAIWFRCGLKTNVVILFGTLEGVQCQAHPLGRRDYRMSSCWLSFGGNEFGFQQQRETSLGVFLFTLNYCPVQRLAVLYIPGARGQRSRQQENIMSFIYR